MTVATVPLRVLTIIFGAGFGGSYVYNNLETVRSRLAQNIFGVTPSTINTTNNPSGGGGGGGGNATGLEELNSQITNLSRQVARATEKASTGPVMLIDRNVSHGVLHQLSSTGWTILVITSGIGGYIAYKKGVKLSDFLWVSRSAFGRTIEKMQEGVVKINGIIDGVKKELSSKMKMLEGKMEVVRSGLGKKIEKEVGQVRRGIKEVGKDVEDVRSAVKGLEGQLEGLDGKMNVASHGIFLLCKVVSGMGQNSISQGTFDELNRFTSLVGDGGDGEVNGELKKIGNGNGVGNGNGKNVPLGLPKLRRSGSSGLGSLLLENGKMGGRESCREDAEKGYHVRRNTTMS